MLLKAKWPEQTDGLLSGGFACMHPGVEDKVWQSKNAVLAASSEAVNDSLSTS